MKTNLDYCRKCAWFYAIKGTSNKRLFMTCHKLPLYSNCNIGSVFLNKPESNADKHHFIEDFKPPETCPYILEHTISTKEEKKQAVKNIITNKDSLFT